MKQTPVEFLAEQLRQLAHNPNTHLGMGDIRVTQGTIDELEQQAKEMEKENQKHIGQITEKGIIDTIGNCANCGVEFHIHKDVTEYKQETLEESAERFYPPKTTDLICSPKLVRDAFKAGAKWQQEQILDFLYSEITERRDYSASKMCEKVIEFIEQFKNK